TEPIPGTARTADVLVTTFETLETRLLFDTESGDMVRVELAALSDRDPCELILGEYRDIGGIMLPGRIQVRVGDKVYTELTIEAAIVPAEPAESDPAAREATG